MVWNRKARLFYRLHVAVNRLAWKLSPSRDCRLPTADQAWIWRLNFWLASVWLRERERLNPRSF